jgi:hypothetical protein
MVYGGSVSCKSYWICVENQILFQRLEKRKITVVMTCGNNARKKNFEKKKVLEYPRRKKVLWKA